MKKRIMIFISIFAMSVLMAACNKEKVKDDNIEASPTPASSSETQSSNETEGISNGEELTGGIEDTLIVQDFYPFQKDIEYVFEGEGNEFASYITHIDFLDEENNRMQTRTNNGGSETVRILEVESGKLFLTNEVNECYYRDSFLKKEFNEKDAEILLMEPLIKGTEWTLPDGRKRFISATDVKIDTPSGSYTALEVTTAGENDLTKDYYAKYTGLIKSVYQSGDMEVTSSLSEVNKNTSFDQTVPVYFPNADEKIYVEQMNLSFHTNDATNLVLEDTIKKAYQKDTYLPILSTNTKINSLYLGDDNLVYADLSPEFVTEMNAGSGYEQLILQSLTNTLGNYYGVNEVYLTIDHKPYESGHILMREGETFQVNMDSVIQ